MKQNTEFVGKYPETAIMDNGPLVNDQEKRKLVCYMGT